MYRKYYNLVVLLICLAAFPIQVVSLTNISPSDDSSICYFHSNNSGGDNSQIIRCDHCNYYFDLDAHEIHKHILPIDQNILSTHFTHKKNFLNYLLSLNSRSPPLV